MNCFYCKNGESSRCEKVLLFGCPLLDGAQAEYVRVPLADGTLFLRPPEVPEEIAVLMADIVCTCLSRPPLHLLPFPLTYPGLSAVPDGLFRSSQRILDAPLLPPRQQRGGGGRLRPGGTLRGRGGARVRTRAPVRDRQRPEPARARAVPRRGAAQLRRRHGRPQGAAPRSHRRPRRRRRHGGRRTPARSAARVRYRPPLRHHQ